MPILRLTELIDCLTTSEIRFLHTKISEILLNKDGNELLYGLPLELRLKIAEYLHFDDLLRVKLVCQSWNQVFSCHEFSLRMIRQKFQTAWEQYLLESKLRNEIQARIDPVKWFRFSLITQTQREHGLAALRRIYGLSYLKVPLHDSIPLQYSNGRVAFQKGGVFDVHDLLGRSFKIVTNANRKIMHTWLLSNIFILGVNHAP